MPVMWPFANCIAHGNNDDDDDDDDDDNKSWLDARTRRIMTLRVVNGFVLFGTLDKTDTLRSETIQITKA